MSALAYLYVSPADEDIHVEIAQPANSIIITLPVTEGAVSIADQLVHKLSVIDRICEYNLIWNWIPFLTYFPVSELEKIGRRLKILDRETGGMSSIIVTQDRLDIDRYASGLYDEIMPWRRHWQTETVAEALRILNRESARYCAAC